MIEFTRVVFNLNGVSWRTLLVEIDFKSEEFEIAIDQATKKSKFTMAASQSGVNRENSVKYNMQLMGIIAEIACKKYLEIVISHYSLNTRWKVLRYDEVRTDGFKSAQDEYDLKTITIVPPETEFLIESRSSITYNRSFAQGLSLYDIIGPYSSIAKVAEKENDIYLRPLYEYLDYKTVPYNNIDFEGLLRNGKIKLYLVAGCTKDEMNTKGFLKSMGQGASQYLVLPIKDSTDIVGFSKTIASILK